MTKPSTPQRKTWKQKLNSVACRFRGHKWGKLSLNHRKQRCERCKTTRDLTPEQSRRILDHQFWAGAQWTPEQREAITQKRGF